MRGLNDFTHPPSIVEVSLKPCAHYSTEEKLWKKYDVDQNDAFSGSAQTLPGFLQVVQQLRTEQNGFLGTVWGQHSQDGCQGCGLLGVTASRREDRRSPPHRHNDLNDANVVQSFIALSWCLSRLRIISMLVLP